MHPGIKLYYPPNHDLIPFGDFHTGSRMSHEDGIKEAIEFIAAEPYRRAVHMGDAVEAITRDDKRFDPTLSTGVPLQQRDHVAGLLEPIKEKLDIMLIGNHEWKLLPFGNLTTDLCKTLSTPSHKVEYGTFSCVAEIHDDIGLMYKIFLTHGNLRLQSQAKDYQQMRGNKRARLRLYLKDFASDCLIMACGHTHQCHIVEPTDEQLYLYYQNGKIKQGYLGLGEQSNYIDPDQRYYVNTGGFFRLYTDEVDADGYHLTGYPELFGYKPMELAFPVIEVRDRKIQRIYKKKV